MRPRLFPRLLAGTVALMLALSVVLTHSQAPGQAQKSAIIDMLQKQAADWNRGDMETFAAGYKKSPDILFMGDPIRRGYDQMLAGYRKSFPTRDAMGTLTFTGLEVQPLDNQFATVTGRFHLQRSAAGGGDAGGYFLLVVEKTSSGWKIIRDDTTGDARKH